MPLGALSSRFDLLRHTRCVQTRVNCSNSGPAPTSTCTVVSRRSCLCSSEDSHTAEGVTRAQAVVGAGASGLVAARELLREGHKVSIFEQGSSIGGTWVYTPEVESDWLGQRPDRQRIHSSMYRQLRTNLPREVMGFTDFPLDAKLMGSYSVDDRRYCSHEEVRNYLDFFADYYGLRPLVQLSTRVQAAQPLWPEGRGPTDLGEEAAMRHSAPRWRLTVQATEEGKAGTSGRGERTTRHEEFDALVVCNGHYSEPNVAKIEGADVFPGWQLHSHNYREPTPFSGKVVLVIGAANSGEDIAAELAPLASRVYISGRSWTDADVITESAPGRRHANIQPVRMVQRLRQDGGAEFEGGARVDRIDAVVYCTGYHYSFPFLEGTGLVDGSQQHVMPLWQHLMAPAAAPSLSFPGLLWKIAPFCMFELQAKYVARVLSGRTQLPSRRQMMADAQSFYEELRVAGTEPRYTHRMADSQWAYDNWLARECGPDVPPLTPWRERMYNAASKLKRSQLQGYRDMWLDPDSAAEAAEEFRQQRDALLAHAAAGKLKTLSPKP